MVHDPNRTTTQTDRDDSLYREAKLAGLYLNYLRAVVLSSLEQFALTPAALCLALSELRRESVDRRCELGRVLMANWEAPDLPNNRIVKPERRNP